MLGPHTHRDNPLSRIMCTPIVPPCHGVSHCENWTTFLFFFKKKSIPRAKMVKRNDKTNTGEGDKGCTPRIGGSKYRCPWIMYLLGRLHNLGAWPTISFQVAIKHTNRHDTTEDDCGSVTVVALLGYRVPASTSR